MNSNIKDVKGEQVFPGDIIYYPKFSELHIAKVIRETSKALIVSCYRVGYFDKDGKQTYAYARDSTSKPSPKGIIYSSDKLEEHNGEKRLAKETWNGSPWIERHIIKVN